MTKAELLQELDNTYYYVYAPEEKQGGDSTMKYYHARVLDVQGNVIDSRNIGFYVRDEGHPVNEEAYYERKEPYSIFGPTFPEELRVYKQQLKTDGTIKMAFVQEIDTDLETAIFWVVRPNNSEGRYAVSKDAQGDFQFEELP